MTEASELAARIRAHVEAESPGDDDDDTGAPGEPGTGEEGEPGTGEEGDTGTGEPGTGEEPDAGEPSGRKGRRASPKPAEDPAAVQARKLETAQRAYRKDVEKIVGGLEGMADCPVCTGFGMLPEDHPFVAAGEDRYLSRDDTERCARCNGLGQLFTGSAVREHALLPCPSCTGSGYGNKTAPAPAGNVVEMPVAAPATGAQVHGYLDEGGRFHPYTEAVQA